MIKDFAHLHVHTEYSLLDGFSRIEKLVSETKALGMNHLAITDHGNMYGALEFYKACKKGGVNGVLGIEAYIVDNHLDKPAFVKGEKRYHHQLLLAENNIGYHNLMKLNTIANTDGMYANYPRIDQSLLAQYGEGIIATSSCLGGEIPQLLIKGKTEEAHKKASSYKDIFGPSNFYLELQSHSGNQEQLAVNKQLYQMAVDLRLQLLATNDLHYVDQNDSHAHDTLLCVQTQANVNNPKRFRFQGDEYFLRSPEQMYREFPGLDEALLNTVKLAERCLVDPFAYKAKLPTYGPIPAEFSTAERYLYSLCLKGIDERYGSLTETNKERLDLEFNMIAMKGFVDYFLIEWDVVHFCRLNGIRCSARGSAAGSLMAYVLGISNVDPIRYQLPFERFFTIEREDMPDIDLDIQDNRRDEVITYVTQKYGYEFVAQIVTFNTMAVKNSIKDVARALDEVKLGDQISRFIPKDATSVQNSIKDVADLSAFYKKDATVRNILNTAVQLQGITRSTGVHAAGLIIGNEELRNFIPLRLKDPKDIRSGLISQYEQKHVEELGLIKFDFLGLTNLTILSTTLQLIQEMRGETVILENVPMDEVEGDDAQNEKRRKAFELLSTGEVAGLFQLDGSGKMADYVKQLKPTRLEDVMAMIALYRPGPMDSIPHFIEARFGREKITYLDPRLKEWLDESYGVIVYQDQVLFIAVHMAGFSWGKTHKFRKALSKKIAVDVAKYRGDFVEGCVGNGMQREAAEQLFTLIEPFGGYGFNKAHAASYAVLAFYGAYLKANYTTEFMAATLTASSGNAEKISKIIVECKRMGVGILGPDVNHSDACFLVEHGSVRFGLMALSGIGEGPISEIVRARKAGAPFKSLADFCTRVSPKSVGKAAIESLIKAGAMDSLIGPNKRHLLLASVERALKFGKSEATAKASGMMSLFGDLEEIDNPFDFVMQDANELSKKQLLEWEYELLGVYISDHPLSYLTELFKGRVTHTIADLHEGMNKLLVVLGGTIKKAHTFSTKKGDIMCVVSFEDISGTISVTVFPKTYEETKELWVEGAFAIVTGVVQIRNDEIGILCNSASELKAVEEEMNRRRYQLWIKLQASGDDGLSVSNDIMKVQDVYSHLTACPGSDHYEIIISNGEWETRLAPDNNTMCYSEELHSTLEALLGPGSIEVMVA